MLLPFHELLNDLHDRLKYSSCSIVIQIQFMKEERNRCHK